MFIQRSIYTGFKKYFRPIGFLLLVKNWPKITKRIIPKPKLGPDAHQFLLRHGLGLLLFPGELIFLKGASGIHFIL